MALDVVDLERSHVQEVSGLPLNNSRVLVYQATFSGESTLGREIRLFLEYQKLARVFMDNTEIEE